MQSENYVPGVSGWKIDPTTGEFELHSDRVGVRGKDSDAVYSGRSRHGKPAPVVLMSGELPQTPQPVTIAAAEWVEWDMPANALERYKFIGDAVMHIPAEYRDSAEFSTEDHSYDRDGSDIRTTLTYTRPETQEEAVARVERAKVAGTKISITNDGVTIVQDGVVRVRLGKHEQPFVVEAGQVFLNGAFICDGVIKRDPLPDEWRVKMQLNNKGQYMAAGIGVGSQILSSADKFAIKEDRPKSAIEQAIDEGNAQKILDLIAGTISETELCEALKAPLTSATAIRDVIREELRPGGLLYRR